MGRMHPAPDLKPTCTVAMPVITRTRAHAKDVMERARKRLRTRPHTRSQRCTPISSALTQDGMDAFVRACDRDPGVITAVGNLRRQQEAHTRQGKKSGWAPGAHAAMAAASGTGVLPPPSPSHRRSLAARERSAATAPPSHRGSTVRDKPPSQPGSSKSSTVAAPVEDNSRESKVGRSVRRSSRHSSRRRSSRRRSSGRHTVSSRQGRSRGDRSTGSAHGRR